MILKASKIFSKLVITNFSVIVILFFSFLLIYNKSFTSFYYLDKKDDLKTRAILFSDILKSNSNISQSYINDLCIDLKQKTNTRYTVIDKDGIVLGDSDESPKIMDNHLYRPEVQSALSGDIGISIRYSNTVKKEMLYLALSDYINKNEIVIRTSLPIESLKKSLFSLTLKIMLSTLIIILIALLILLIIAKKITNPLEKMVINAKMFSIGNFSNKINFSNIYEINSLAISLNKMASQLGDRIKTITNQKNENDAILLNISEGLIATNKFHQVIKINDTANRLFDFKNDIIGKDIRSLIRNIDFLKFYNDVLNIKNNKIELFIDGINKKNIFCSGTTILNEKGKYNGNVIIINDVTKIKVLETIRKEFVANVSHELKTPLTALKGYVETLKETNNEDERLHFISILDKHTTRMNLIIDDLLELSRLEEIESTKLEKKETNILNLINESIQECEISAINKKIKIITKVNKDDIFVLNPRLIQEAIVNLIQNAINYSEQNSTVIIESYILKNKLYISVKDFGIGIEQNQLNHIFKRFYCIDKSHSKALGGTGLGLSIVKHIIKVHNGEITVKSTIKKGSVFKIKLS